MSRVSSTFLLALVLTVGGCGSDQPESAPPAKPVPSQSPEQTATSTPSATPTSPPSAAPHHGGRHKTGTLAPNARPRRAGADHLLAPDDLPDLAGAWSVTVADGGVEDPTVGACQKTGLGTIGALESVTRTYSANDATAVQVVARFADSRSAWRAQEVLTAWRDDCGERLGKASVGDLEDVTVPIGVASSYRAEYRKRSAGLGILRSGTYLTVVEITSASYPDGWEPARVAVRRIARTF